MTGYHLGFSKGVTNGRSWHLEKTVGKIPTMEITPGSSEWPFWWYFKWPFQGLSDLHLGNQKVTWKKLAVLFQIASSISRNKNCSYWVTNMWMWMKPPRILQWSQDPDRAGKKSLEFESSLVDIFYAGSSWCFVWKFHRILRSLIDINLRELLHLKSRTVVAFLVPSREEIWSGQIAIIPKPECFGHLGRIPILFTTIWGGFPPAEIGRCNLPRYDAIKIKLNRSIQSPKCSMYGIFSYIYHEKNDIECR